MAKTRKVRASVLTRQARKSKKQPRAAQGRAAGSILKVTGIAKSNKKGTSVIGLFLGR